MADLKIQWALPTTRESGNPLDVADIKHVRIELSADSGANYALIGDFLPDVLETVVQALDSGTFTVRGLVADKQGRVSQPVTASIVIDETAPGVVVLTLSLI